MTEQKIRGVLLDIEGTTSSIRFVYDTMFPYVRENLESFLATAWDTGGVQDCLPLLAQDLGHDSIAAWLGESSPDQQRLLVNDAVIGLMDADVKATGLKQLQGVIWKDGFESGQMVAHLYDDVAPAIEAWHAAGLDVRIYSSGSIAAQKLFFGHTVAGDLLSRLNGHYDTTTGPKQDALSYQKIAAQFDCAANEILFVSDVVAELQAAESSGLQVALSLREGNKPVASGHGFRAISSFSELKLLD